MKVIMFACAQSISIDSQTNNISLFNIIEEINVSSFPIVINNFVVFSFIIREESEPNSISCRLKLILGNELISEIPFELNFQSQNKVRSVVNIMGFIIPTPGLLKVSLNSGEDDLSSWFIDVKSVGQPHVQQNTVVTP